MARIPYQLNRSHISVPNSVASPHGCPKNVLPTAMDEPPESHPFDHSM